jgi:hypothetical protein
MPSARRSRFGWPNVFSTDQGPQFLSEAFSPCIRSMSKSEYIYASHVRICAICPVLQQVALNYPQSLWERDRDCLPVRRSPHRPRHFRFATH